MQAYPTSSPETLRRITIARPLESGVRSADHSGLRDTLGEVPPRVSSKYLYDTRGSKLFERICEQPEYYQTRTEYGLLQAVAADIAKLTGMEELVEIGSGAATKTPVLLDAMRAAGNLRLYVPFDVSDSAVEEVAESLAERYEELRVHGVVGDFLSHLNDVPSGRNRLVIFLGGTFGNLSEKESRVFLDALSSGMQAGEYFLLGTDLVKNVDRLEAAYNDAAGVTAAFNLNSLRVLNEAVGADFDVDAFEHRAFYDPQQRWIEMRVKARSAQTVRVSSLGVELSLAKGEEIQTEISRKYTRATVERLLETGGFRLVEWFTDPDDLFALTLAQRV